MENPENCRNHYNLYFIFLYDKHMHPMPSDKAETIKKNILKNISEKLKLLDVHDPPC